MADKRKLQGEIERCLKKVQEGVEFFEDLWQKVQNATNLNIKEKHEADLKKEIKKLQRLRDGIKTWLASSEIKDKKTLLDAKKVIETQMERFKVIERETKTKAYSKEGLGAATKVDPKEKEKEDITCWLSQSIDELNVQIDQYESEIEGIISKKKKLDRDKQDLVDLFRRVLDRHRYHIDKLETIMRLVDNDALPLSQIAKIREDVDFYISSSRESDFEENEFLYDDLKLDEASAALGSRLAAMNHDNDDRSSDVSSEAPSLQNSAGSISPSPSLAHSKDAADDEVGNRTRLKSQSNDSGVRSGSSTRTSESSSSANKMVMARQRTTSLPAVSQDISALSTAPNSAPVIQPSVLQNYAQAAGALHHHHPVSSGSDKSLSSSQDRTAVSRQSSLSSSLSASVSVCNSTAVDSLSGLVTKVTSSMSSLTKLGSVDDRTPSSSPSVGMVMTTSNSVVVSSSLASLRTLAASAASSTSIDGQLELMIDRHKAASPAVNGPATLATVATGSVPTTSGSSLTHHSPGSNGLGLILSNMMTSGPPSTAVVSSLVLQTVPQSTAVQQQVLPAVRLDPLIGIAPLGPQALNRLNAFQLEMLDSVARHLPQPADSQRIRTHFPHSPYVSTGYSYYLAPAVWDSLDFYSRLDTDTLFFIFYYMEGTKAQFMAAKTLKLKSWRFHTKHLMWFQRHDEPTQITEDYEQGSYWYFDYEAWTRRRQDNFTFEYRYLEDHDLK
jgi:CCR4-NOT transcription complex subunit 3